jgi:hypothetical protein
VRAALAIAVLLASLSAHCTRDAEKSASTRSRPTASAAEASTRGGTAPETSARGGTVPEASPSAGAAAPGRVTLAPDAVASAGIETVALARITVPAEIDGFGRVLDPLPLVDALHARAAARSAAAAARAEHERVLRLHRDEENASTRDVENARAALDRADAELANATARVTLAWGVGFADDAVSGELVAGRAAVARIDLPVGEHVEQVPSTITVAAIGRPERPLVARVLGPAPTADAIMQGDGYLVLIAAEPPPAGTALRATVTRAGAPLAGVGVPRAAIVWSEGRPAAYIESGPGAFERRELVLAVALPGAWLVTDGVAAGERVVTTGAAQLLSAETLAPDAQ